MKLAKKMLAGVMALALVAVMALTAFAAAPVLSLTASEAKVGENVTVTVAASGMAGLMSADLEFAYDATALEFVSVAKADGAAYDMGVGDKIADGAATWSIIYTNEAAADSALVTLTFKVLKEGASDVSVKVNSWDGTEAPAGASVTINVAAPTTIAPTEPTSAKPVVPVVPSTGPVIPQAGEAGVAAIAGVMAIAAVAFVATRKKDEE